MFPIENVGNSFDIFRLVRTADTEIRADVNVIALI